MPPTRSLHNTRSPDRCPYCGGNQIIRKGIRRNKHGNVQLYRCRPCKRKFSPHLTKHKSFPLRIILESISLYNRLHSLEQAAAAVSRKYGLAVSRQNVRNWIDSYAPHLPFLRLRPAALRAQDPRKLILRCQLLHAQTYTFQFHRAKADIILGSGPAHRRFAQLRDFLENVPRECPHHLFREQRPRASSHKGRLDLDGVVITPRHNAAVSNARFALQAVSANKLRHAILQDFMLANDSVTIAVEVPITLDAEGLAFFRERACDIPFTLGRNDVITGHIDIVQIRYGLIHILDYKPGARGVRPIEQLTIYAMALSHLTGIRLNHFKCAWFDDEHYFDFFPRTVLQKGPPRQDGG